MTIVRVGLIGYGFAGATFHAPIIGAVPGLELAAVVTTKPEAVRHDHPQAAVAVYADAQQLFDDPAIDLVVVATPNESHEPLARRALLAGKHVVVDKPFTIASREADELIALAQRRGRLLSVYHNRRWDSDFRTVRKLVEAGTLGELYSFEAHYDRHRPAIGGRWREQNLPGSGTLYDLGAHLIDQALVLFGPPEWLWADVAIQRQGTQAPDYFHLALGYGRLKAILHSGMLVAGSGPRYQLHGLAGSFAKTGFDPQEEALKRGGRPGDPGWGAEDPSIFGTLTTVGGDGRTEARPHPSETGAYEAYYLGMAAAIRGEAHVPVRAEDAANTIRIIERAMESSREGRRVMHPARR